MSTLNVLFSGDLQLNVMKTEEYGVRLEVEIRQKDHPRNIVAFHKDLPANFRQIDVESSVGLLLFRAAQYADKAE